MTATTMPVHPVTLPRVISSEWIKLRSLRSTKWTLALAVLIIIGLSVLISSVVSATIDQATAEDRAGFEPISSTLVGVYLAQLAIGILGVLTASGEYSTGSIRSTLAAVPSRLPVLWAKLIVQIVTTLVLTGVAVLLAFFLGQALLGDLGTDLGAPNALRAVAGVPLYLAAIGALGVALGFLLRHSAGAIACLVGVLLVLPIVMSFIPGKTASTMQEYLPSSAGGQILTVNINPDTLGAWAGFGVLCVWVLVATAGAAFVLKRRDA